MPRAHTRHFLVFGDIIRRAARSVGSRVALSFVFFVICLLRSFFQVFGRMERTVFGFNAGSVSSGERRAPEFPKRTFG